MIVTQAQSSVLRVMEMRTIATGAVKLKAEKKIFYALNLLYIYIITITKIHELQKKKNQNY